MDPLDRKIEKETKDIAAMDGLLEAAHRRTNDQNALTTEMQATLRSVIEQERRQDQRLVAARSYFEQMKYDLYNVVQHFHAKDELKTLFLSFHNCYMKNEKVEDIRLDEDVEAEHHRQKATLEKQLLELRRQHIRDDAFQTKEQGKLLLQNARLIDELQGLRTQNRQLMSSAALAQKKSGMDRNLLPATEAQRRIEENKKQITKLEGQLALYNEALPSRPGHP
jgi:predicted ribosome quality control (RQC) complex YloA/Tae2 family protein